MAANLGLVAHAAERDAHEFAPGRFGDRFAERGLAHAGRTDQTQDRSGQLIGALLHREILDDALLDLFQAEVIGVENLLGEREVLLDLGLLVPRDREQPVEIVAHDGGFRRHRRHLPQLLDLVLRLLARFLRQLGALDLLFELGEFVLAVLVAQFLLDRLHLLVEVILALRLLHLALDPRADALLDLQHRDFALHQPEHLLQPLGDDGRLQDHLLVGNLHREMRSHGVGELGVVLDLLDHADDFRRHLLVELHIAFEFVDDRARQRFGLDLVARGIRDHRRFRLEIIFAIGVLLDLRARGAFDQHLHGAVGQLEKLQHAGERADAENGIGRRIVVGGVLLRRQQDERVRTHHLFERLDGLLAADEQRNDHVRENNDVPQRQHRIGPAFTGRQERLWFGGACHGPISLLLCTPVETRRMRCHDGLPTIGGVASRACQERPVFRAKSRAARRSKGPRGESRAPVPPTRQALAPPVSLARSDRSA